MQSSDWKIIYILPNATISKSIEGEAIALVGENDPRIQADLNQNKAAKDLISRFMDTHGKPHSPGLCICRKDLLNHKGSYNAISIFRDLVSVPTIVRGIATYLINGQNPFGASYTDTFDFSAYLPSNDPNHISHRSPGVSGLAVPDNARKHLCHAVCALFARFQ